MCFPMSELFYALSYDATIILATFVVTILF